MIPFYYSDIFNIPLPDGHRFPGGKYRLLREQLVAAGVLVAQQLVRSPFCDADDLRAVHEPAYVDAVLAGTLSASETRRIGLPWSEHLVKRSLATMGGAFEAARAALSHGVSGQLAGGTHHAHGGFGAGYCVFNDFAIVADKLIRESLVERIAIIDLDVHQGDGNAAMLGARPDVFILDLYCEKNYPFRKVTPHMPVPLAAGTGDGAYLAALDEHLDAVLAFKPDLVLYQAGVDPLCHDSLGRLDLSYEGLIERDRLVFTRLEAAGIPVSIALGGGYSKPIERSVTAYANTFTTAKEVYRF